MASVGRAGSRCAATRSYEVFSSKSAASQIFYFGKGMVWMNMDVPKELQEWPSHVGNWGRWPNDRGTLNLITPQATLRGVSSVRNGHIIHCARETLAEDPVYGWPGVDHKMEYVGMPYATNDLQTALDVIKINPHGMVTTHIDALSHVGYKGYTFNGRRFDDVVDMENGAKIQDVRELHGIVTRGVFVDVARARGIDGLAPGDSVKPDEISEALGRMQSGDAFIVRTGVTLTHGIPPKEGEDRHGQIGGLHIDCIDMIAEAGACVLASDSPNDTFPSPIADVCLSPVHRLSLVFWGMPLIHNMDLERLGKYCAEQKRDDFLFTVAPLNIPNATGSPCTPVAVF